MKLKEIINSIIRWTAKEAVDKIFNIITNKTKKEVKMQEENLNNIENIKIEMDEEKEEIEEKKEIKQYYKYTEEELGSVFAGRIIKTDVSIEQLGYYVQEKYYDDENKIRWKAVQISDKAVNELPAMVEDLNEILPPGEYLIRVVNKKNAGQFYGSRKIDIQEKTKPEPEKTQQITITVEERISTLEKAVMALIEQQQKAKETNQTQNKTAEQILLELSTRIIEKMVTEKEKKSPSEDEISKRIAQAYDNVLSKFVDLQLKLTERKSDIDFEMLKHKNQMEIERIKQSMSLMPPSEQKNVISQLIDFVSSVSKLTQDALPLISQIKEISELQSLQTQQESEVEEE